MRKLLLPLLALAALVLPAQAITDAELAALSASNGFYRASVMTVNGYNGAAPLTNFPVLVKIKAGEPAGFQYSDLMFPDKGDDIGFVDLEGNGLPFEIDEWNTNGTSVLWVKLPSVATGTNFVMVYRSAQTGKSLNNANPFADYVGVWHLGETATGSTTIKDSTDNKLNGTSHANSSRLDEGAIGGGRRINTSNENSGMGNGIQVPLDTTDSPKHVVVDGIVPAFTASFWWRHPKDINSRWSCIIGRKNGNDSPGWGLQFEANDANYTPLRVFTRGTTDKQCQKPANPQTTKEVWYKVDLIYSYTVSGTTTNGNYTIYWNGANPSSGDTYNKTLPGNTAGDFCIGGGGGRPYTGWMDEVRLRKFVPTTDWVKAEYDQATVASFLGKAEVVEFFEPPKPVISATRGDFGAAFVQFSGAVSQLGGDATSCDIYAKVWPAGGAEPATGTLLASGLVKDATFTDATVTGLTPQLEYQWKVYAVNDLTPTAYESDPVEGTFETAGVGGAGTGGVVTRVVDDYVHVFEIALDGTATYEFTPPSGVEEAEVLLVGGGGPGGFYAGGGGGAGGLVHDTALAISGGTTYTVTVGRGGQPATALADYGTNGGDSLITSGSGATTNAIAFGGGAGGNGPFNNVQNDKNPGRSGGSGGGSAHYTAASGSGTTGQGSAGGIGLLGNTSQSGMTIKAGGGGGAGGVGGDAQYGSTHIPGTGGNGIEIDITGTKIWYAGGGSGGGVKFEKSGAYGYRVAGGLGGGGIGGMESDIAGDEKATAGTDGLGGGGGGGSGKEGKYMGAAGGSGVVVVRYPATGTGAGATEPMVSLTGLEYDSANNVATLSFRVAWAGAGYQTADVTALWGFSEDDLSHEVPLTANLIGRGSGTITGLPSVSRTVYVKVKAANAGDASGVSTETRTIALYNPRAPEATIANTSVAVDGGAFSVDVTNLGQGAASVVVSLQSCANRAFAAGVVTNAGLATIAATGSVAVAATGLTDSSTWWVRAVVSNDLDQVYETDPVSITTLTPGYPNGSGSVSDFGFASVSAVTRTTLIGLGSTEVTRWLEASEDESFSTLVGTPARITDTRINADGTSVLTGLAPDTAYHLRLALSNDWNRVTYVRLEDFATRAEPFVAAGPMWAAGDGTFSFLLDVAAVYDGAQCEATLTYGGAEIGAIAFDDPSDVVAWPGVPAAADGALARIVVTATLPNDGGTFTRTYEAPVAAGSAGKAVTNVANHASAVNALRVRPGDAVALPTPFGGASYQSLNERFATIEGSTLVAREPGIVGIRCVDAAFRTNIMGVVILPDPIGAGKVYIYDETKVQAAGNGDAYNWSNPNCWVNAADGSRVDCPTNADDIAVVPFYVREGNQYLRHRTDVSLGGIYAGMIRPDAWVRCGLERYKDDDTKTVTFERSDGKPVRVQVCPSSEGNCFSTIRLGGWPIDVVWANDAVIDGGSSETDVDGPRGFFEVNTATSTNTLRNVTLTIRGLPGSYTASANGSSAQSQADNNGVGLRGVWKGAGTIVKEGQGCISFVDDFSGFAGSLLLKGEANLGGMAVPAAQVMLRAAGATNLSATAYGVVSINASNGGLSASGTGNGVLGAGGRANVGPRAQEAPGRGLALVGGTYWAGRINNSTWGVGAKDEKVFDFLSLGPGLSYFSMEIGGGNQNGYPINAATIRRIDRRDRATLGLFDKSRQSLPSQSTPNCILRVGNWTDLVTGAEGDCTAGAVHPIVPWAVSAMNDDWSNAAFATFDETGRLVYPIRENSQVTAATSENANLHMTDKNLDYGAAGGDYTINSLSLSNGGNNRWLGADRTLRIKSGGLILHGKSAIGLPGRDDNGALVLGDATHPAYVWAKAYKAGETNYLGAAVTAPGGFVSAYPGNLALVGDQTGIADEIAVNAGTLALGTATEPCTLADDLPIRVCRGATLILPIAGAVAANPVLLDGSDGAFGRIELATDQRCATLGVRDVLESDEWTFLPRGTYGATGSGAEFVRDDLFSGSGVLGVGASDEPQPMIDSIEWIPELATERTGSFLAEVSWLGFGAESAGLDAYVLPAADAEPWNWAAAASTRQALATFVSRTNATVVVRGLETDTEYVAWFVLSNRIDGVAYAATNGPVAFSTLAPDYHPSATCRVDRAYALAADLAVVVPRFGFEAEGLSSLSLRYGTDPADESGWTTVALEPPEAEGGEAACRLLGLAAGTTYYARAFATNTLAEPQGFATEAVSFTTASGDSVDESQPWVEVSSVAPAQDALHVAAAVRWTGFGSDAVRVLYRVAESAEGIASASDAEAFASLAADADASFDVPGLTPGVRYFVRVSAVNERGVRTESAVFSAAAYGETMTAAVAGAARTFDVGRDRVAVFTNSAETLTFSTVEGGPVEILLVGGGGAGGSWTGGGGGAGGFVHLESLYLEPGTTYEISVGAGGRPTDTDQQQGGCGGDSSFALAGGGAPGLVAHGGGGGGGWAALDGLPGGSGGGAANNRTRTNAGSGLGGASTAAGAERGNAGGENDTTLAPRIEKLASGGGGAGAPGSHAEYGIGLGGAGGDGLPCSITGEEVWYAGGGGAGQYYEQWQTTDVTFDGVALTYLPGIGGRGGGGMGCSKDDDVLDAYECGADGLGGGGGGGRGQGALGSGTPRMGAPGGSGTVIVRWRATPSATVRATVLSVAGSAKAALVEGTVQLGGTSGATIEMRVKTGGGGFGEWRAIAEGLAEGEAFSAALEGLEAATRYDYEIRATDGEAAGETLGAATGSFSTYYTWPAQLSGAPAGAETNAVGTDTVYTFATNGTYSFAVSQAGYARLLMVGGGGAGGSMRGGGGGAGGFLEERFATLEAGTYTIVVGAGGAPAVVQSLSGDGAPGGDGEDTVLSRAGDADPVLVAHGGGGGGCSGADAGLPGNPGGSGGGGGPKNPSGGGASTAGARELGSAGGGGLVGNTGGGDSAAGGGGGAGGAGGDGLGTDGATGANRRQGGAGGAGFPSDISGETRWYAAGGGGGCWSDENGGYKGLGGSGIGGDGGGWTEEVNLGRTAATAGADGTGSGGGGGGHYSQNKGCTTNRVTGGAGGCGAFVLRISPSSDYRPAAEVETLAVRDGEPTTVDATISLRVVGFGGAPSIELLYGPAPDALAFSVPVASGASIGVYEAPVPGLSPGATWYFAPVASNSRFTVTGAVASATLPAAPAPRGEPGSWGLWQTQRRGEADAFRDLFASGTLWEEARSSNLVAGAIAANAKTTTFEDPATGETFSWGGYHMLFAYRGWIYLDGGRTYAFGSRFANCVRLSIDGETLIDTFASPITDAFGALSTDAPGWHEIDARVGRTDGAWGPDGNGVDSWISFGLALNDADYQSPAPIAMWTPLVDPGDGSLLRPDRPAARPVQIVSADDDGGTLSISGLAGAGDRPARACVVFGAADGGVRSTNDWDAAVALGEVAPTNGATALPAAVAGWGTAARVARLALETDGEWTWSAPVAWMDTEVPSLSGVQALETGGGDTAAFAATVAGGTAPYRATLWMGAGADSLAAVAATTVPGAGAFTIEATDLEPGSTYWWRLAVEDARGIVVRSDAMAVTLSAASRLFDSSDGSKTAWETANSFENRQRTVVFRGQLVALGAGETTVRLLRNQSYDGFPGASATEPHEGEELVLSATGAYELPLALDWDLDVVFNWSVSNGTPRVSWGPTASARDEKGWGRQVTVVDATEYAWAGGASGSWTNEAAWTPDGVWGTAVAGYPRRGSYAVFPDAGSFAVAVPDAPEGLPSHRFSRLRLGAGAEVEFGPEEGASAPTLHIRSENAASDPRPVSIPLGEGAALRFRDIDVTLDESSALTMAAGSTLEIEGCTATVGNNPNGGYPWSTTVGDGASFVFRDSEIQLVGNAWVNGRGSRMVVDDARITMRVWGTGPVLGLGAPQDGGAPTLVIRGANPRLAVSWQLRTSKPNQIIDFEIPEGGWTEAPIRPTSTVGGALGSESSAGATIVLRIPADSPAVVAGETLDVPLVRWPGGVNETYVVLSSENLPHPATDSFYTAADPETGHTVVWAHLVGQADTDEPQAVDFRVAAMAPGSATISFVAIPGSSDGSLLPTTVSATLLDANGDPAAGAGIVPASFDISAAGTAAVSLSGLEEGAAYTLRVSLDDGTHAPAATEEFAFFALGEYGEGASETMASVAADGPFSVWTFTNTAVRAQTFAVTKAGYADVLVVGGGGSGGAGNNANDGWGAGGGGGGGVVATNVFLLPGTYAIEVGAGAPRTTGWTNGRNGSHSSFGAIAAPGGGGGSRNAAGLSGASGGGGSHGQAGGAATAGFAGGAGVSSGGGGGGGGATAPGADAAGDAGGDGGAGVDSAIAGEWLVYGAGGGGGSSGPFNGAAAVAGAPGGPTAGAGSANTSEWTTPEAVARMDATRGFGGGGGGGAAGANAVVVSSGCVFGGAGGDGVVIVRMRTATARVPEPQAILKGVEPGVGSADLALSVFSLGQGAASAAATLRVAYAGGAETNAFPLGTVDETGWTNLVARGLRPATRYEGVVRLDNGGEGGVLDLPVAFETLPEADDPVVVSAGAWQNTGAWTAEPLPFAENALRHATYVVNNRTWSNGGSTLYLSDGGFTNALLGIRDVGCGLGPGSTVTWTLAEPTDIARLRAWACWENELWRRIAIESVSFRDEAGEWTTLENSGTLHENVDAAQSAQFAPTTPGAILFRRATGVRIAFAADSNRNGAIYHEFEAFAPADDDEAADLSVLSVSRSTAGAVAAAGFSRPLQAVATVTAYLAADYGAEDVSAWTEAATAQAAAGAQSQNFEIAASALDGTTYLRFRYVDANGVSRWSDSAYLPDFPAAASVPPAVAYVATAATTADGATLVANLLDAGTGASAADLSVRCALRTNDLDAATPAAFAADATPGETTGAVSGLLPAHTYYARFVANNGTATGVSGIFSFTTADGERDVQPGELAIADGGVVHAGDGATATARVLGVGAGGFSLALEYGREPDLSDAAVTNLDASAVGDYEAFFRTVPGATHYYRFVATADGGAYDATPIASFTTLEGSVLGANLGHANLSHHSARLRGILETLGAGTTTIYVYAGTNELEATEYSQVVGAPGAFAFDVTFPGDPKTVLYAFKSVNVGADGTEWESWSATNSLTTVDAVTYTWNAAFTEGSWTNAACWTPGAHADDCIGYPNHSSATVQFTNNTVAVVDVPGGYRFGGWSLSRSNVDVTLRGEGADVSSLSGNITGGNISGCRWTFEAITVEESNGVEVGNKDDMSKGANSTLALAGGAVLRFKEYGLQLFGSNLWAVVGEGSSIQADNKGYFNDGTVSGGLRLDGGTLSAKYVRTHHRFAQTGNQCIFFAGAAPRIALTDSFRNDKDDPATLQNDDTRFVFTVPAEGWAEAPVFSGSEAAEPFAALLGDGAGRYVFSVDPASPLVRTPRTRVVPLADWRAGIDAEHVSLEEGRLPNGVRYARLYYVYGWPGSRTEPNGDELPTGIRAEIRGIGGTLLIFR